MEPESEAENNFVFPVAVGRCTRAHVNVAVMVGFDSVWQTGKVEIGEHFSTALDAKRGLIGGILYLDRQGHFLCNLRADRSLGQLLSYADTSLPRLKRPCFLGASPA
jgi:hypothetical protein